MAGKKWRWTEGDGPFVRSTIIVSQEHLDWLDKKSVEMGVSRQWCLRIALDVIMTIDAQGKLDVYPPEIKPAV